MDDLNENICSDKSRSNIDINEKVNWPTSEGVARVPFAVFSDEEIYDLEHCIYCCWCILCCTVKLANVHPSVPTSIEYLYV